MQQFLKFGVPLVLGAAVLGWQWPAGRAALPEVHLDDQAPAAAPAQPSAVKPLDAAAQKSASATIDKLVNDQLAKQNLKPLGRTSDEIFLRRVYLDLMGRIPTFEETNAFLTPRTSDKREKLVKSLIGSEGYLSHQFTFWADLLRASTRLQERYPGQAYIEWIKQALRENKPYDKMVSELLQAEGPALARGNGATGYYIRDAGMPLDNMSNTIQVFLGTQLACAQCHNHPNDKWTRMDYYEMAAFTSGTAVQKNYHEDGQKMKRGPEMRELAQKIKEAPPQVRNTVKMLSETIGLGVTDKDSASIALPHDYQYADAKPGAKVDAHPMFGEAEIGKGTNPRAGYASWMINQPRFAQVIANRLWKKATGTGVIEPVDNLRDDTAASNPELMDFLTRLMVSVKFDLRKFQEVIYSTEVYQRESVKQDVADEAYAFQGLKLRRLTAEQVWDSLMTLAVSDIDTQKGVDAEHLHVMYEKYKDESPQELFALAESMSNKREEATKLRADFQELKEKIAKATNGPDKAKLMQDMKALADRRDELMSQSDPLLAKKGLGVGKGTGARDGKSGVGNLLRAAELPSPAPNGHFLRTFGQSDRQLIDNGSDSPAVTQALSLMNGLIEPDILSNRSVLTANVLKGSNAEAKAKILWLTILSREPTRQELTMAARVLASQKDGADDLAWALINSNEFLFVR
jgi:Protein of unknown function (DUF1549)/Protein of unknown function (DUF1553)